MQTFLNEVVGHSGVFVRQPRWIAMNNRLQLCENVRISFRRVRVVADREFDDGKAE